MLRLCLTLLLSLLLGALSPNQMLIEGCLDGNQAQIEEALKLGADLETRHHVRDLTPLMLVIYRDYIKLARLLLEKGARADARNQEGQTPLMLAAAGGQHELIALLAQAKAPIDEQDEQGNSALMWAAFWGHQDVVEDLIMLRANPNLVNEEGNTVLQLASQGGISQKTRQLLKRRVAPNGRRLNSIFDGRDQAQLLKLLLQSGADPNHQNHQGQSALMLLAAKGFVAPVNSLLDAGADLLLRDQQGKTAADYAQEAGWMALAKQLSID